MSHLTNHPRIEMVPRLSLTPNPFIPEASITVEPKLPRMQPILPSGFDRNGVSRFEVRRGALQDAEPKVRRVGGAHSLITAMSGSGIVAPAAQDVVSSIGGADVAARPNGVVDEVDAPPLQQRCRPG